MGILPLILQQSLISLGEKQNKNSQWFSMQKCFTSLNDITYALYRLVVLVGSATS